MALGERDLPHVATRLCQFTPATMEALGFLQLDNCVIPMPCGSGLDDKSHTPNMEFKDTIYNNKPQDNTYPLQPPFKILDLSGSIHRPV